MNSLINATFGCANIETSLFVTGMHMLKEYGHTYVEVLRKSKSKNYLFINQRFGDDMDSIFGKTIQGFSDYIREHSPDMVVVHGDRVEAMAAAIVAMLNGCRIAHIEGGEISGTVDESIRHAITKISNLHFVSNEDAARRLIQLGEEPNSIYEIGSPEVDVMASNNLPNIKEVKRHYGIEFEEFAVCIFHPVTTEQANIAQQVEELADAITKSAFNFLIVLPNNDSGSAMILKQYEKLDELPNIRILPSMRFEYYLVALREARFIIGNSSSGVREAPFFGVPTINLGTRQNGRSNASTILNVDFDSTRILSAISEAAKMPRTSSSIFGNGGSGAKFVEILSNDDIWNRPIQKQFVDVEDFGK